MSYSILINSCDRFEDCWSPFFQLLSVYWPDCSAKIYINTEYKDFRGEKGVVSVKCCEGKMNHTKLATWSQCLRWALEKIDTDIILYMQEDYFLKGKVNNAIIEEFVRLMEDHLDIKCIHLTDQASKVEGKSTYDHLYIVKRHQTYRVSCQAALWRKEELLSLVRDYENAWEFELFGSKRSSALGHLYLGVDPHWVKLNDYEVIPYVFTGIIRGQWKNEVVPLFRDNGIEMDFSIRGFYDGNKKKNERKGKIKQFLRKKRLSFLNQIELFKIKLNIC